MADLTPNSVVSGLMGLARELDAATRKLRTVEHQAVTTREDYTLAYAKALLKSDGSNSEIRKAAATEARAKALVFRRDPFQRGLWQLIKKPAFQVVAGLPVQHARLRMAQVQTLARAGDGHIHEAAFFFEAVTVAHGVFVREQAFFHAGDEDAIKLQPFGRVHRHQLHRVLAGLRLVVTRLERGMRQKGS